MDGKQFDALTRFVATPRTRRQVVRAVGGSLVAACGALTGLDRAAAATCADRCSRLADAVGRTQCLAACAAADQASTDAAAARATAAALRACVGAGRQLCGSGAAIVCCGVGETCQAGKCIGGGLGCDPVGAKCDVTFGCCSGVCLLGVGCCPVCTGDHCHCDASDDLGPICVTNDVSGQTCVRTTDCDAGYACLEGYCQQTC